MYCLKHRFFHFLRYAALGSLLLLLQGAAACGTQANIEIPELIEPAAVRLDGQTAQIRDIYEAKLFDAYVCPETTALSFTRAGTLGTLYCSLGAAVSEGDLLALLDDTADLAAIASMEAAIAEAEQQNAWDNEHRALSIRQKELELIQNAASLSETEAALLELEIEALKREDTYEQDIQAIQLETLYTKLEELRAEAVAYALYAPCDGVVSFLADSLHEGASVTAFDPVLAVTDTDSLHLRSSYMQARTVATYNDYYALIGGERYDITYHALTAEEYSNMVYSTSTPYSTFSITGDTKALTTGMYAGLVFRSRLSEQVLSVPTNALYEDADGDRYLYVIEDGVRVYRAVTVGRETTAFTEIVDGLTEGELVYVP